MTEPLIAAANHAPAIETSRLDKKRHIKYFLRCLKTYLPPPYTSNDSNRLSLAFFIIAALDLLDGLEPNTTPQERADYADWVYSCQNPEGGFRAFPGSDFGALRTRENACWDPAHVPGTYFALCLLLILGDDFSRLDRDKCLKWLRKVQRDDGSFGETLVNGEIEGGNDSRFGYCAAGIWYILTASSATTEHSIQTDKLEACVRSAKTYDGGISDSPVHEAHAGFTFCALGILAFLHHKEVMQSQLAASGMEGSEKSVLPDPAATIRWLLSRQTTMITEGTRSEGLLPGINGDASMSGDAKAESGTRQDIDTQVEWAGFSGRCNKIADTCYAFWVSGALDILGQRNLIATKPVRCWLLERTQHPALGGFGKIAGDLPDVYHSYLGLATLSMMRDPEDDLQELDATMCISQRAKDRLSELWKRWGITR